MNIIYPSLLTLLVASLPPAAYAQGPTDRNQPGWDVTLSLNSFYVRDKSQMNTNDDNAITTDLQQSGTSTSELLFAPLGNVQYTFASGNTQLFAGQSTDQVIEGQLQADWVSPTDLRDWVKLHSLIFLRCLGLMKLGAIPI
ncbi:hypothetical protein VCSRO160_0949 [Vibrio cholerae]|nr:hypothetical protein VCSRO160_0949 [Vibrio cholerae]